MEFQYQLSGEERERCRKLATGASPITLYDLMYLAWFTYYAAYQALTSRAGRWLFATGALLLGLALIGKAIQYFRERLGKVPRPLDVRLQFDEIGVQVEVDGSARRYSWLNVREARKLDEFYVIKFRRGLVFQTIPIPDRALPEGGVALWYLLEQHLVGKRMLVLPTVPPSRLVNTSFS
jgi:hypothetical protein